MDDVELTRLERAAFAAGEWAAQLELTRLRAERDTLAAELAAAVEALSPFAKAAADAEDDEPIHFSLARSSARHGLTIGDLREAARTLSSIPRSGKAMLGVVEAAKSLKAAYDAIEEADRQWGGSSFAEHESKVIRAAQRRQEAEEALFAKLKALER